MALRDLFALDPGVVYLNHGSFGACPLPVLSEYRRWQEELERQPVEFLGRRAPVLLDEARAVLAAFVGADPGDLVWVPNATTGLNAVIRSLRLEPEDEVLRRRTSTGRFSGRGSSWVRGSSSPSPATWSRGSGRGRAWSSSAT